MAYSVEQHLFDMDSMATTAHGMGSISGLLEELKAFDDDLELNEQNRLQMLQVARDLVRALETPRETVLRLCWAEVSCTSPLT
jgi:hypothetical protein